MADPHFQSIGAVEAFEHNSGVIDLQCKHGRVRIAVLSDSIVRVRATQTTGFGPDFSYAVAKTKWPKTNATVRDGKTITIRTKKLVVTINKSPLRIEFATPDGRVLNGDEAARGMGWDGPKCRSHRTLAADEMFFGCGEKTSPLNKRGSKTTFWNTDDPNHTYVD